MINCKSSIKTFKLGRNNNINDMVERLTQCKKGQITSPSASKNLIII